MSLGDFDMLVDDLMCSSVSHQGDLDQSCDLILFIWDENLQ